MRSVNDRLVEWIDQKVRRAYADDIDMVLLYGSYVNGTANSRSDVDCYFIPRNERAYGLCADFIIDGVGYDIFPMSWERVEGLAELRESLLPCLGDVRVLYARSEECLRRFEGLQARLRSNLQNPDCTRTAARQRFDFACSLYAQLLESESTNKLRTCAGYMIAFLADAVALNEHEYYHYGLKRQYADLCGLNVPADIAAGYLAVTRAKDDAEMALHCGRMLHAVAAYAGFDMLIPAQTGEQRAESHAPDWPGLAALYEEISSTFNKIYVCCESGNSVLAFISAVCLQNTLDDAAAENGLAPFDVVSAYRWDDLARLSTAARRSEQALVQLIEQGGARIKCFASFEEFEQAGL